MAKLDADNSSHAKQSTRTAQRERGFTIVELLVVIVVIAILAAISIAAYTGIQQRAEDTARLHAAKELQTVLALYHSDHGAYPPHSLDSCNTSPTRTHCRFEQMRELFVPDYVASIPDPPGNVAYHRIDEQSYAIGLERREGDDVGWYCRILVNASADTRSFGSSTPLCE